MSIASLQSVPTARSSSTVIRTASFADRMVKPVVRAVKETLVLTEIALPEAALEAMREGLEALGGSAELASIEETLGGEKISYQFTLIKRGSERFLIHLDDGVLGVSDIETRRAINDLRDLFKARFGRGVMLYVVHDGDPHPAHVSVMEYQWPKLHDVICKFVPMSLLAGLGQLALEQQVVLLEGKFDLGGAALSGVDETEAVAKIPSLDMEMREIRRLRDILAARAEFTDEGARGRKGFVEVADLRDFAAGFDFVGGPRTVAYALISDLLDDGLGLLLDMMRELEDLSPADAEFIRGLLERYSFA